MEDPADLTTYSFLVRVWLEETETESEDARATWGGNITRLPDGPCRSVRSLSGITDFIAVYLEQMGVVLRRARKVRQWFGARRLMGKAGYLLRAATRMSRPTRASLEDADEHDRIV